MEPDPGRILAKADQVDLADLRLPTTDLGNARRLVHHHGEDLRYASQLGRWFAWDGARFAEDLTGEVDRRAKAVVDNLFTAARGLPEKERRTLVQHWHRSQSAGRLRAMIEVARTEPRVPVTVEHLDADPFALNVANGTLDLRTGDLRPHDRAELHTKLAPVAYDPGARAPTW